MLVPIPSIIDSQSGISNIRIQIAPPDGYANDGDVFDFSKIDTSLVVSLPATNIQEFEIVNAMYPFYLYGHVQCGDYKGIFGPLLDATFLICNIIISETKNTETTESAPADWSHEFIITEVNQITYGDQPIYRFDFVSKDAIYFNSVMANPISTFSSDSTVDTIENVITAAFPDNLSDKLTLPEYTESRNISYISEINSTYMSNLVDSLLTIAFGDFTNISCLYYNMKNQGYQLNNLSDFATNIQPTTNTNIFKIPTSSSIQSVPGMSLKNVIIESSESSLSVLDAISPHTFYHYDFSIGEYVENSSLEIGDAVNMMNGANLLQDNAIHKVPLNISIDGKTDIIEKNRKYHSLAEYNPIEYYALLQKTILNQCILNCDVPNNFERSIGESVQLIAESSTSKPNSIMTLMGIWIIIEIKMITNSEYGMMNRISLIRSNRPAPSEAIVNLIEETK